MLANIKVSISRENYCNGNRNESHGADYCWKTEINWKVLKIMFGTSLPHERFFLFFVIENVFSREQTLFTEYNWKLIDIFVFIFRLFHPPKWLQKMNWVKAMQPLAWISTVSTTFYILCSISIEQYCRLNCKLQRQKDSYQDALHTLCMNLSKKYRNQYGLHLFPPFPPPLHFIWIKIPYLITFRIYFITQVESS